MSESLPNDLPYFLSPWITYTHDSERLCLYSLTIFLRGHIFWNQRLPEPEGF